MPRFKDIHFHSLRTKGMVVTVALLLIVSILGLVAYTLSLRASYSSSLRNALESKAVTASSYFAGTSSSTTDFYQNAAAYADAFEDKDLLEMQFLDNTGLRIISSSGITVGDIEGSDDVEHCLRTGRTASWQGRNRATGEKVMAVSTPISSADGTTLGVLRYITSLRLMNRSVAGSLLGGIGICALVMAVVLVSNIIFFKSMTSSLESLTIMAQRIAEGSYGTRVEKKSEDEIGRLTDAINDMSQKLSETEKLQTEFISSVSHELRTPLTAINGWCDTISGDEDIQGDSRKGLEIISTEARRLTKMVQELLEFTRIQNGRFTLQVSTVDLEELVEDTLYTYNELLRKENIQVHYEIPTREFPEIPGDPDRIKQVLVNILSNAIKYGKSGGRLDVDLVTDGRTQAVTIRDYGPGVPEEELPKLKEKFYKAIGNKERGSGIGLAVCDEIMKLHNGSMEIANAPDGGLSVTLTLPTSNSTKE